MLILNFIDLWWEIQGQERLQNGTRGAGSRSVSY